MQEQDEQKHGVCQQVLITGIFSYYADFSGTRTLLSPTCCESALRVVVLVGLGSRSEVYQAELATPSVAHSWPHFPGRKART